MFTGIVEELGTVERVEDRGESWRLSVRAETVLDDARPGDSIAVNGCCLTVAAVDGQVWAADVMPQTLSLTALGDARPGDRVNLERAASLATRLGGHLVQGHVDGVGTVTSPAPDLRVTLPDGLGRYVVEKGSITIDGVSLTVVDAQPDSFSVAIIPHTAEVTTLGRRQVGDGVNLEVDVTAKYVERLLTWKS
jgi:riboflavin synthase